MNNNYFRKFITLSHENGQKGKSFGTFVAEKRDGINKFNLSVSNIRPNLNYCITLIKVFEGSAKFVDIKTFTSDEFGSCSIRDEIKYTTLQNIEIQEFDVCVIRIANSEELITPLVGYFNEKVKWREYYTSTPKPVEEKPIKQIQKYEPKQEIKQEIKQVLDTVEDIMPLQTKPYEFGFNKPNEKEEFYINTPSKHSLNTNNNHVHVEVENKIENDLNISTRKYKLKTPVKQAEYNPIISPIDDFDMTDDNIKYTNTSSDDMLEIIKGEIKSLKDIALESMKDDKKCAYEDLQTLPYSIEGIFEKGEKIAPFKINGTDVDWVIIDYSDLVILDNNMNFVRNPFVRNSYKKFSHFILGKCIEDTRTIYILGVPDYFNHEFEQDIRNIGFISFKESFNCTQQGYWIIIL